MLTDKQLDQMDDTPVFKAFVKLRKEAKLMLSMAEYGAFAKRFEEEESEAYNLNSAIEYAHSIVDLAHELRLAVRDAKE